jgi:hypothetical protein
MKRALVFTLLASLFAFPVEATKAQPSNKIQQTKAKIKPVTASGGVDTIPPQEPPSKDRDSAAGWNGSYVGVNAGMGFGATAGSNVVVPFGTDDDKTGK